MTRETVYVVLEDWGEYEDATQVPYLAFTDLATANRCAFLHGARLQAQSDPYGWDDFNFCMVREVEVIRP